MLHFLGKCYRLVLQVLCLPVLLSDFFDSRTGAEYGIGFLQKLRLFLRMASNSRKIISSTNLIEHCAMVTAVLNVPRSMQGILVECGSYKGASAISLSMAAKLTGRKLYLFDSFMGLPAPDATDKEHLVLHEGEISVYNEGTYCGTLDEVKENIRRLGCIDVCEFHKGFFETSLPHFKEKIVFLWTDVDYLSSEKTCLQYLWPLLQDGCQMYTHEATEMEVAALFFDRAWWKQTLGQDAPGLVGAGNGLGLEILKGQSFSSNIAYTVKNPKMAAFLKVERKGNKTLSDSLNSFFGHRSANS